ncbi:hypothetical protein [Asticcacaulis sp. AC402]|uniref:hypothetical protein n=1 Tax=Asticcacaulis sp. AC402 TaxID=1282361 RepID=UPI0003C3E314|nr:hypothetical protein [Asticcacaulis sp. AC402]ESQ74794.1 hypothetical protein ABAC402_12880 [Asticcacaulis sp. AC402]
MTKDEIWPALIATCPSFQALYDELDDEDREFHDLIAGDFVRHLAGWDSPRPAANLSALAAVIETLVGSTEQYFSESLSLVCWNRSSSKTNLVPPIFLTFNRSAACFGKASASSGWLKFPISGQIFHILSPIVRIRTADLTKPVKPGSPLRSE